MEGWQAVKSSGRGERRQQIYRIAKASSKKQSNIKIF